MSHQTSKQFVFGNSSIHCHFVCVQVVDTPGILDHPLEERNTIEMQAITALAHLRSAVLYVMDVSEQCGHTLQQQLELFNNIRPLFANKVCIPQAKRQDCAEVRRVRGFLCRQKLLGSTSHCLFQSVCSRQCMRAATFYVYDQWPECRNTFTDSPFGEIVENTAARSKKRCIKKIRTREKTLRIQNASVPVPIHLDHLKVQGFSLGYWTCSCHQNQDCIPWRS